MPRTRVFVGVSLDGFIAGPNDELDWLSGGNGADAIVIGEIRLPRTLLALAVGAALGLAGAALQGLLRNPLADPGLTGASQGAALGAATVFYFGLLPWAGAFAPALAGLCGAAIALVLMLALAGSSGAGMVLLAGLAISTLSGALLAAVLNFAPNPYAMQELVFWLLGSVSERGLEHLLLLGPALLIGFGLIWGQRTTRLEWAGILLGLIGIGLLNLGSNLQASPLGAVLIIFAAAAWSFGSMWSKNLKLPAGPMASAVEMLAGGVALLAGSLLSGERMVAAPTLAGWGALAYLILFGSIIAFSSYLYLLKNVRPAAATSYAYVNPVVAVLLGIAFAGESIGLEEGLAMLVIIGAVVLIGLPQWRERKEEKAPADKALQQQTS